MLNNQLKFSFLPNGANLGFEEILWQAADKLRGHIDPSSYKQVVLGLIFLRYVSDLFEANYGKFEKINGINPEDPEIYTSNNVFWIPVQSRWTYIEEHSNVSNIGSLINSAIKSIEEHNEKLIDLLPKEYDRPSLNQYQLLELFKLISNIRLVYEGDQSRDIFGRVYEYFINNFASTEGKNSGEFFTPRCVVRLLVKIIEPFRGIVYDPCCGSGGMFIQSEKFIEEHGGDSSNIFVFGQESNWTTWQLAKLNLLIRGISADLGPRNADTFYNDLHKDLKANYILANPPFNMSDWGAHRYKNDIRWKYGLPPSGNANFAWIQHIIHHLADGGIAAFILTNGSLSSGQQNELNIRRNIIENDLIDCIVTLPSHLFYGSQISACIWIISPKKHGHGIRNHTAESLFIDARHLGTMVDRIHKELSDDDIEYISNVYNMWRKDTSYENIPGFSRSVSIKDIQIHKYNLVPGRYVGFKRNNLLDEDINMVLNELNNIKTDLSTIVDTTKQLFKDIERLLDG